MRQKSSEYVKLIVLKNIIYHENIFHHFLQLVILIDYFSNIYFVCVIFFLNKQIFVFCVIFRNLYRHFLSTLSSDIEKLIVKYLMSACDVYGSILIVEERRLGW